LARAALTTLAIFWSPVLLNDAVLRNRPVAKWTRTQESCRGAQSRRM